MNWINNLDDFLLKNSLSFYQYLYRTLDFDKKDKTNKWKSLTQNLKEWNKKYLNQYENISLRSPVLWNLNITINSFYFSESAYNNEDWLYWMFLSFYTNYCVLNELILREDKNKFNPQEFILKSKENIEIEAEDFLNNSYLEYLFKKDHAWIDKKIFLQELAQKRENSYKRLIYGLSNNKKEQEISSLSMYKKYEKYENLFQGIDADKTEFEVVEINPQGMNNLFDDCMCYVVKAEDQVYILYFEDYA